MANKLTLKVVKVHVCEVSNVSNVSQKLNLFSFLDKVFCPFS